MTIAILQTFLLMTAAYFTGLALGIFGKDAVLLFDRAAGLVARKPQTEPIDTDRLKRAIDISADSEAPGESIAADEDLAKAIAAEIADVSPSGDVARQEPLAEPKGAEEPAAVEEPEEFAPSAVADTEAPESVEPEADFGPEPEPEPIVPAHLVEKPDPIFATIPRPPVVDPPPPAKDAEKAEKADAAGRRPPAVARPKPGAADNLKRIKGIGPKYETVLHELGIHTFVQIAEWTTAETEWISAYMGASNRIKRDNWIPQAMILAAGTRKRVKPDGG